MPNLTVTQVRNAKPAPKAQRLFDGGGLYLEVTPSGGRYWRWKYRFSGKEKLLALGVFPAVSLAEARQARDEAKKMQSTGVDPGAVRQAKKRVETLANENTFETVAREWLGLQEKKLSPATFAKAKWTLETLVFPWLGAVPVADITPPELLSVLRRIESRGANETAHRTKARCGQVFRYAIATGRATRDPSSDLRGALAPVISKSRAAITDPLKIGDLLRAIEAYPGGLIVRCALKISPMVFLRPGELRHAEWSEFDLENAEWRIPGKKMKMRVEHIVPLSKQAVQVLKEIEPFTGKRRYVFPSLRSPDRPMSANTINVSLRLLGFDKDTMTGHGFRALASTRLNEMGWAPDVIERQLAHAERNRVRAAYNRAQYLPERRKMMQAWADYLDSLKSNVAKVIPIRRGRKA